jgi:GDP-4-dehydro-6-deoxy-D-mannose reductase
MPRALVTGGSGFVGRHLVAFLQARGDDVAVVGTGRHSFEPGVIHYQADLRDAARLHGVLHEVMPESIYHLAGVSTIGAAAADPQTTYEVNVKGAHNLFEVATTLPGTIRILNVSSSQVYAPGIGALTEGSPTDPVGPYAISKAMAEAMASQYREQLPDGIVTVRPFNHTGPGQSSDFVLSSMARQFAEIGQGLRRPILSLGNVHVKRDFSDVRDVVRAYSLLLSNGEAGQTYNVCSGVATSITQIIQWLEEIAGFKVSIESDATKVRTGEVAEIYGDHSKIQRETGWHPQIGLRETLEDLLSYWRSKCESSEATLDVSRA